MEFNETQPKLSQLFMYNGNQAKLLPLPWHSEIVDSHANST